jgi:hypothetical protein
LGNVSKLCYRVRSLPKEMSKSVEPAWSLYMVGRFDLHLNFKKHLQTQKLVKIRLI